MVKKTTKKTSKKNLPEKSFRAGNVSSSIWKREIKPKKGKSFIVRNVEIVKNYTDEDGKWNKTSNFNKQDLIKAEVVLRQSIDYLYTLKDEEDEETEDEDEDELDEEDEDYLDHEDEE